MIDTQTLQDLAKIRRFFEARSVYFHFYRNPAINFATRESEDGLIVDFTYLPDREKTFSWRLADFASADPNTRRLAMSESLREIGDADYERGASEVESYFSTLADDLVALDSAIKNSEQGAIEDLQALSEAGYLETKQLQSLIDRIERTRSAPETTLTGTGDSKPHEGFQQMTDHHVHSDRGRWAGWPFVSLLGVVAAAVALAAAPNFGVHLPTLFPPNSAVLHGAVIIGLSIIGAAIISVRLQFFLTDWRSLEDSQSDLELGRMGLHDASISLDRSDGLIDIARRDAGAGKDFASPLA